MVPIGCIRMEEKKRPKTIKQLQKEGNNKTLRIFRNNFPLTKEETAFVIDNITDDHIALLAKGMPREVSGKCLLGGYVGQGVCLAKKFGKYGVEKDPMCVSCKHTEVLVQLNYIFKEAFKGKYRAKWVQKK
jgi:hypothetical protein